MLRSRYSPAACRYAGEATASQPGVGGSGGSEVTTRARTSIVSELWGREMPNSITSVPK
jgi:hypothetical protein